ncbi:hypothetical protein ACSSS7_001960 [Eimeria intestinalis]
MAARASRTIGEKYGFSWQQTMLRIKDPNVSVPFYERNFGMKLVHTYKFDESGFSLYFLERPRDGAVLPSPGTKEAEKYLWNMKGVCLELTHNHGSEKDPNFKINNGNEEPHRGFGHIAFNCDDIVEASKELEQNGDLLGMKLIAAKKHDDFSLYFLTHLDSNSEAPADPESPEAMEFLKKLWQPVLELTHNHGTENDPSFKYHNGNDEPQGFGHTGMLCDDLEKACEELEAAGATFRKKPQDGKMHDIAFVLDPDGYSVELIRRVEFIRTPAKVELTFLIPTWDNVESSQYIGHVELEAQVVSPHIDTPSRQQDRRTRRLRDDQNASIDYDCSRFRGNTSKHSKVIGDARVPPCSHAKVAVQSSALRAEATPSRRVLAADKSILLVDAATAAAAAAAATGGAVVQSPAAAEAAAAAREAIAAELARPIALLLHHRSLMVESRRSSGSSKSSSGSSSCCCCCMSLLAAKWLPLLIGSQPQQLLLLLRSQGLRVAAHDLISPTRHQQQHSVQPWSDTVPKQMSS